MVDCVLTDVLIGLLAISSRSGVGADFLHLVRDIDPGEPSNMSSLLALWFRVRAWFRIRAWFGVKTSV